ncbi:hypothetical protein RMSM_05133 [Rhodopirellula maiorica SM1]|uniref:Uncharacterized protein n=1 Tax=Rhodopirellula maiorica SM1 TaxID=1265738 RepID=M5RFS8_9BACT|nr:hypothetical protein [Rhodopirellula maiorica]EMI17956.1 hypothetical protein RMSM_05133 [Rhodopirellula maiorica SM1]
MSHASIDPVWIAKIVREVIERVKQNQMETGEQTACPISGVISVATVMEAVRGGKTELRIATKAIVTPAARDEAKLLGITITRGANNKTSADHKTTLTEKTNTRPSEMVVTDIENPERAEAISQQLSRRGIRDSATATIILSDAPSKEVYRICSSGRRAAVISSIANVDRIEKELAPQVWVLDMNTLNFVAAVNVAARILK